MELALFFVLPLIGGFAFVTGFLLLRYKTGREDAQRLYYRAALFGVFLAFIAALAHEAALRHPDYARFVASATTSVLAPLFEKDRVATSVPLTAAAANIRVEIGIVCIYAFLLGALTPLWNLFLRLADYFWAKFAPLRWRRSFLDRLNLAAITDQLEWLLAKSLFSASLIQVTLSNSKVYVGSVLESLDPRSPAKYFKIQPWMSGYRDDDGTVQFNTFYDDILAAFEQDASKRAAVETFQLVIPIDKVLTASGFDVDAYESFLKGRQGERSDEKRTGHSEPNEDRFVKRVAQITLLAVLWRGVSSALRRSRQD